MSDEDIIKDYALTTIGLQLAIPLLAARFEKEQVYRDNIAGTINMGTARYALLPVRMLYIVCVVLRGAGSAGRRRWAACWLTCARSTAGRRGI